MSTSAELRLVPLLVLALLAACGSSEPARQDNHPRARERAPATTPPASAGRQAEEPARDDAPDMSDSRDASEALRTYYGLLQKRDYAGAARLREGADKAAAAHALAEAFDGYATLGFTVGAPSRPVATASSTFVEVPIQTYGVLKNGKTAASAGTVTLRRRNKGTGWLIYGQ